VEQIAINIPNGGLTTFNGIIISNLGFSSVNASLLSMPTGVMSALSAFVFSYIGAKWANRRCLVTIGACLVPIIGTVIVYTVDRKNVAGQMVGIYLVGHSTHNIGNSRFNFSLAVHILWPLRYRHWSSPSKHCWPHQKNCHICCPIYWICGWQFDRSTNVPCKPSSCIHRRCCGNDCLLLRVHRADMSLLGALRLSE
jgi:hypothetical protein